MKARIVVMTVKAMNITTITATSATTTVEQVEQEEVELVISVVTEVALCLGIKDDTPFSAVTVMLYRTSGLRPREKHRIFTYLL
jgi:hypothetical protein